MRQGSSGSSGVGAAVSAGLPASSGQQQPGQQPSGQQQPQRQPPPAPERRPIAIVAPTDATQVRLILTNTI